MPNRQVIAAIAHFVGHRRLLEVCAGNGLWARLLCAAGVQVIATDGQPARGTDYYPIEPQEAEAAVRAHPECAAALFCWPPFRNDCAYRALRAFEGDRLVYVGDPRFTADAEFHGLVARDWSLQERILIPAWPGLDDYTFLYVRTDQAASIQWPADISASRVVPDSR